MLARRSLMVILSNVESARGWIGGAEIEGVTGKTARRQLWVDPAAGHGGRCNGDVGGGGTIRSAVGAARREPTREGWLQTALRKPRRLREAA